MFKTNSEGVECKTEILLPLDAATGGTEGGT